MFACHDRAACEAAREAEAAAWEAALVAVESGSLAAAARATAERAEALVEAANVATLAAMPLKEADEEASLAAGNVLIQLPGRRGFAEPVDYRAETTAALEAAKAAHAEADAAVAEADAAAAALKAARAALRGARDGGELGGSLDVAAEALARRVVREEACPE